LPIAAPGLKQTAMIGIGESILFTTLNTLNKIVAQRSLWLRR
jgi:hypothetical protein